MGGDTQSTRKSTRQVTESPPRVRKSKRLKNETPPSTPPTKRTSERLQKCNTPDSLRRSGRGMKESSPYSVSKELTEEALSNSKRKKEKTVIQVMMESKKADHDPELVGMKRKNLSARKFKSLFKKQRIAPDGGDELERSENIVGLCSDNGSGINSQPMEDTEDVGDNCSKRVVGKLRDESNIKISEGALPDLALRDYPADVQNDISVDSCSRDYVVDDPGSNSSNGDKDSESSQEGSTSGNCSKRSIYYKVAEDTASASLVCGYCNLEGTCLLCSKSKRVRFDSPEQELCSCSFMGKDLVGAADSSTNDVEDLCSLCNKDGNLLTCQGKNCRNCYHLYCLDPPLTDALPGAWHCPRCVKKKLLLGVHSVSTGVESIWDVRKVVVPNAEGAQQRQFLVKYRGLAHVHNHWVPETQLLLETPSLVSNFLEKDQDVRWNAKWMVPHRLLRKRPIQNSIYVASTSLIWVCQYEWLVKWRDLDYDHATWELDNANFISSFLGQDLVRNYEIRRGKAKSEANKPHMEPIIGHSEIPVGSHERHVIENVNKVRKFLLKCPSAVVSDDQERTTAIHLIGSMIETFRSLLIVANHDSLSRWEANFERLVPSVDVVVYSGSADTRNMIRASEFYDEGGRMIVQVLLSSVEAVLEDLEILKSIKWKAIVIDEYQYSGIPEGLEQIKMLSTDMRVVLDATSEHLKILPLVEPQGNFDKLRSLKSETNGNLCKLKERLSPFILQGHTSEAPKFIEYWVPVQISNLQLEYYCAALLSHSNALCSRSKKDPFCVLQEVLLTVRKCCHHPYLVDPSVQACLIADKHPTHVVKDVGIKASGKLQLLDVMLSEIKTRGLRVLILYQPMSSGQLSSGSILLDLLFHRFGLDKYEHVDAAFIKSEKQAATDRFNKKNTGQFVFLLDNRACSPCIKFSSLDIVVIYDSDWNPANDLRALKKISIDSKVEEIKVLRLYSSFTIEERALLLAKQKFHLDQSNFTRGTSSTLLSWGATYLFNKLDEYHADSNSSLALNFSGQLLLDKVTKEFQAILSENFTNTDSNSVISEAKSDVGNYSTSTLVFGESEVQLKDGEEDHVFWKKLLEGRNPPWKHLTGASPRNRKKVHYWEGSVDISEAEKANMAKKRKKMVNESLGPGISFVDTGPSATKSFHQSESFHRDGQSSLDEVSASAASKERIVPSDEQQSTHGVLQRGMKTLCQHLNLPENVIQVAEKFLEYVIRNHHVNSNSTSIVQALQMSLCWVAASITDQKIDKKGSLVLAKQHLGYKCTEEEVSSVYAKMRSLKKAYLADPKKKKVYLECTENGAHLNRDSLSGEGDFSRAASNVNNGELQYSSYMEKGAELEIGGSSANKEHAECQILTRQKVALNDEVGANAMDEDDEMKIVQKKCDEQMQKYQEKIEEVERIWKDERDKLEKNHKLESSVTRSIHGQTPAGMAKLNRLDVDFNNKIKDIDTLKDAKLKGLLAEHLAVINNERQRATDWLAKTKSRSTELRVIISHQSLTPLRGDDAGSSQPSTCLIGDYGDRFPIPGQLENENPVHFEQGNDVIPSISSGSAPTDARSDETPAENLVSCTSGIEVGANSLAELLIQSEKFIGNGQAVPAKLPLTAEQVSDENQWVKSTEEHPLVPETVPNKIVGHDPSQEESNEVRETSLSNDLVCQRSEPEVVASGCVHSPGQPSLQTEQIMILPDSREMLPQDADALNEENRTAPQIEIARSEPTNSVRPVPHNFESHITDDIVSPDREASDKAPVDEVFGQLHSLAVDISLSCDQLPATEHHDQERSSPQTAEAEGTEVVLHQSISQAEENLELHPNHVSVLASTSNQPNQAVMENDVAVPQAVVSISGQLNQAVPNPPMVGTYAGNLHVPGFLLNPTRRPVQSSPPSLLADPLQNEIERIQKETEQLEKSRMDMMAQLKSDCEKEIEMITAQIRDKYEVKSRETDAEFRVKLNELDKNQNKLHLNKMLANAFRLKCVNARPSGLPSRQGKLSVRPSPGPSAAQPAPSPTSAHARSLPTTSPAIQQLSRSYAMSSSPSASQNVTAHPIQGLQRATAHMSGNLARPPVISVISAANLRPSSEIRSVLPHLQSCRPVVGASMSAPPSASSATQLQPLQVLPKLPSLLQQPLVAQKSRVVRGELGAPPGFAERRHCLSENRNASVPDIPSNFRSLEQSDLEMLGNNTSLGNQAPAVEAEKGVVCLSDDE